MGWRGQTVRGVLYSAVVYQPLNSYHAHVLGGYGNRQVLDSTLRSNLSIKPFSFFLFLPYLFLFLTWNQTIGGKQVLRVNVARRAQNLSVFGFVKYPSAMTWWKAQFDPSQIIHHFYERPCQPVKWWLGGNRRTGLGHASMALCERKQRLGSWQRVGWNPGHERPCSCHLEE